MGALTVSLRRNCTLQRVHNCTHGLIASYANLFWCSRLSLSAKSRYAFNPIEEDDLLAENLAKHGQKILKLNRGDPGAYFPMPPTLRESFVSAIQEGKTSYTSSRGVPELVKAVTEKCRKKYGLEVDEESVVITQGVSEALQFINLASIDEGDHAVLFRPHFPIYTPLLELAGGRPSFLDYDESADWNLDIDELDRHIRALKALKKVKYLLITNPNNPTGTVLTKKVLEEVVELAVEHNLILVSDEIYDEVVYKGTEFTSVAQVADGVPYVLLGGASKAFLATGLRIGYTIIPNHDSLSENLKRKIYEIATLRVCANTPSQYAVAAAMNAHAEHEREIAKLVDQIQDRSDFALKLLRENEHLQTVRPQGAFYLFPRVNLNTLGFKSDKEFVETLLKEERVQLTRGSGFGSPGHVRIVSLAPKEVLSEAIGRLNKFCAGRSKPRMPNARG